jgi:hypothetical protein
VTVHDPICTDSGNIEAALYGSFFPIPPADAFPPVYEAIYLRENTLGAVIANKEGITINKGRKRVQLRITNIGDRPIQVRLHKVPRLAVPSFLPYSSSVLFTVSYSSVNIPARLYDPVDFSLPSSCLIQSESTRIPCTAVLCRIGCRPYREGLKELPTATATA